jgi:two-component system chemotaxis response regulator CheY
MTKNAGPDPVAPTRAGADHESHRRMIDVATVEALAVLVVDDAAMVRSYHRAILSDAGFAVREACNGYEALELTLAERFALIVVDVNMPVMDGYTFVEGVRRQALVPDVPIIMISTEQMPDDSQQAYRKGANLYLVKPAAPEQLMLTARLLTGRLTEQTVGGGS